MSEKDFENIYLYYYRPLCLYALHFLGDTDVAEDIVEDCFMRLWDKLNIEKTAVDNTKAYLYMAVRNKSIDELRRMNQVCIDASILDMPESEVEPVAEMEAQMWTAIDSLPDRCREIFLMSKRDGMRQRDIAQELGLSVNTVENQICKALRLVARKAKRVYTFFFFC